MTAITIRHRTTYSYEEAVSLGPHRLMLRPRESRDLRLLSHEVTVTPKAELAWSSDVFGNAVAIASIASPTDRLVIDSVARIELDSEPWPVFPIAASAIRYPFLYSEDEWTDLGAMTVLQYEDPGDRLRIWAKGFVRGEETDTLALLKDLNAGVGAWIGYREREEEGTQSPSETLDRGTGTCRDFAVLFAEAARSLGFGARIVSGYLSDPDHPDTIGSAEAGSTHAWVEVYVPGAGWISFDPTNRGMGGYNLVPVCVARNIHQTIPVSGSFAGGPAAFREMEVEVVVSR